MKVSNCAGAELNCGVDKGSVACDGAADEVGENSKLCNPQTPKSKIAVLRLVYERCYRNRVGRIYDSQVAVVTA